MDEKIYTLVSSGLLAVIVLLLLLIVGRLARLERALGPRPAADKPAPVTEEEPSVAATLVAEAAGPSEQQAEADEEPFERDGRWWFRREGQLLVYNEQTEAWVDPEPHVLDEAKGWDSPAAATAAPIPEPVSPPEPIAVTEPVAQTESVPEPVTQPESVPEPVTQPESTPEPTPVPDQSFVQPEPVTAATPSTSGYDDSPQPEIVTQEAPAPTPAETEPGQATHWKCPACGVINGSTATSCRMCFAARP